jgi:Flp pilus assembly protein TadG
MTHTATLCTVSRLRPCRPDRRHNRDRGSIGLIMFPIVVMLFIGAGLVLDGGSALGAREHAADVARQAARAGADALSANSLRTDAPNGLTLDPDAARQAAQRYLDAADLPGSIIVTGTTVTVTATATWQTKLLTLINVHQLHETITASAQPVLG